MFSYLPIFATSDGPHLLIYPNKNIANTFLPDAAYIYAELYSNRWYVDFSPINWAFQEIRFLTSGNVSTWGIEAG